MDDMFFTAESEYHILFPPSTSVLCCTEVGYFRTLGLPEGVLSNRPCPLVRPLVRGPWSVFKYLRDRSLVFSNFLHEVRAP